MSRPSASGAGQAIPLPGFESPVFDAQRAFRGILEALSRPGVVVDLARPAAAPPCWPAAMAAVALTLLDLDTPVWLDGAAASEEALRYLAFHCGCPLAGSPDEGAFALVAAPDGMPPLDAFRPGGEADPDGAATVVVACASLDGGPRVVLSGPGVDGTVTVAPAVPAAGFWDQWARNHRRYPQGVDVLLTSGTKVLGLPRSVRAEPA